MKKYIAGFMLFGVLMFSAPLAQAVTVEDLYKEIKSLKEEVNFFKTQLSGQVLGASVSSISTLLKGSKGASVQEIQTALKLKADGVFGSMTETAVKNFQASAGLPVTGVVDSVTKLAIMDNASGKNIVKTGCIQTAPGMEKFSLNASSPAVQKVNPGSLNVVLGIFTLENTSTQDICYINGLQVGSYQNVNSYLQNVRIVDLSTGVQVGGAINGYDVGGYYGTWNLGLEIPLKAQSSRVYKLVGDIRTSAPSGDFKFGFFGVNHSGTGSYSSGLPVESNLISVVPTTNSSGGSTKKCSSTTPSIKVISPNGGEKYKQGDQMTVKWESCNITPETLLEINIHSSVPVMFGFLAPTGTPNDGSEVITVGSDWTSGSKYKISIGTPLDGFNNSALSKSDKSNSYFSITSKTTDPTPPTDTGGSFPAGCSSNSGFSATTGMACSSGSNLISYWWGKVNQHTNPGLNNVNLNKWETDPDGVSGADLDKLTYCKKWFPNTTAVTEFMNQTLVDWKERGNVNNWTSIKMAYKCVQ